MDQILNERTRFITVVLEDIYQPQNASAVIRTCECFGIQDLYVVENKNRYHLNPDVTLGSSKWVNLYRYNKRDQNNTRLCLEHLRNKGYKIVVTSPHTQQVSLQQLDLHEKIAIVFGNEKNGISDDAREMADAFMTVPMVGFTESLNISVCAAVTLHYLSGKVRERDPSEWKLSEVEKSELKLKWIKKIIKRSELLEQEYYLKKKKPSGNKIP